MRLTLRVVLLVLVALPLLTSSSRAERVASRRPTRSTYRSIRGLQPVVSAASLIVSASTGRQCSETLTELCQGWRLSGLQEVWAT